MTKILIIRLSSLGDIVLTQPVPFILRKLYPNAEIDFVVKPQFASLVELMGCGLNIIPYQKSMSFHLSLSKKRYDIVIDLHAKLASFLIRLFAKGKRSVCYDKERAKRVKIVKGNKSLAITSTLDLYNTALKKLGIDEKLPYPKLYPKKEFALSDMPQAKKKILIFPGAAHKSKQYPLKHYQSLIYLSPKDWQYIILGSMAEKELAITLSEEGKAIDLCGKLSFEELLSLMKQSDWVISSDSGPMHMAAAVGVKQIALFGPTHPRLGFAPLNDKAHILSLELSCRPCSLHGSENCPLGHFDCLNRLKPESILEILEEN